jgi:stage II sporulation protein P
LLKERPDAAFDVHRDSAPTSAYFTTVNGVNTSRVMIVVGRSNPNLKTNLDYARRVKSMGDSLYPGMMRGIFIGKGDYNQDLYPTALIFEIGTEQMSLDLAQNAATCLGDVIAHVMIQT